MAVLSLSVAVAMSSCSGGRAAKDCLMAGLDPERFEAEIDGKPVSLYSIKNGDGLEVAVTNYGGRIAALLVPDRDGNLRDVVLGFDSIEAYLPENNETDFGAAIGRYANRIDHGRLPIDGDTLQLPVNNFGHTLHGGPSGWQYKVYTVVSHNDSTLVLSMDSPDGDNGFPGNVKATVTYTARSGNRLDIAYSATTDRSTVINLTNHSYFNLCGDPAVPVTSHELYVHALGFTPVDSTYMTTGEILPVVGTPMDFTEAKSVGRDIDNYDYEQLKNGDGYDHNWVLDTAGDIAQLAAELYSPESGISMSIFTNEPGLQVYSGNFLDGSVTGKGGKVYARRAGMALETQHYPDSPNKPGWPSVVLHPGETYSSHTVLSFATR